jgi:hypothetical protein
MALWAQQHHQLAFLPPSQTILVSCILCANYVFLHPELALPTPQPQAQKPLGLLLAAAAAVVGMFRQAERRELAGPLAAVALGQCHQSL